MFSSSAIVVMNRHVEATCARRDHLADPAHTEDTEALAGDLPADHERRAPVLPQLVAHDMFAFAGAPRRAQHQQHRDLGGGVGKYVGRIRYDDLLAARRFEVDVIDADRKIGDRLYPGRQSRDCIGVEFFGMAGQYRIGICRQLE
jgi:hypothetical protein